uniref:Uncharacterized protein n=1 Tax=Panagrolaimus sp. PS1159 TaxID=55785 RepID=A0AC35GEG1_9BILA
MSSGYTIFDVIKEIFLAHKQNVEQKEFEQKLEKFKEEYKDFKNIVALIDDVFPLTAIINHQIISIRQSEYNYVELMEKISNSVGKKITVFCYFRDGEEIKYSESSSLSGLLSFWIASNKTININSCSNCEGQGVTVMQKFKIFMGSLYFCFLNELI